MSFRAVGYNEKPTVFGLGQALTIIKSTDLWASWLQWLCIGVSFHPFIWDFCVDREMGHWAIVWLGPIQIELSWGYT